LEIRRLDHPPLQAHHDVESFNCGVESLNSFLAHHALTAPRHGLSQTWVSVTDAGRIVAYHTLSIATVTRAEATPRLAKGMPNYDIPCVLLARLAVDRSMQGQGLGAMVLEAAMRKALALGHRPKLADGTPGLPVRALIVHALDAKAAGFYRHYGFEAFATEPLHLLMLLKDLALSLS